LALTLSDSVAADIASLRGGSYRLDAATRIQRSSLRASRLEAGIVLAATTCSTICFESS
jgi:hypothetical protein